MPVSKTWNTCNFDCLQIFNIQNNWIIDINSWMVISLFLQIIWLYALKTAKSICPLTLFWLIPSDWSHLVNGQHLSLKNRLNLNSFEFTEFLSSRNTYSYKPLWGVKYFLFCLSFFFSFVFVLEHSDCFLLWKKLLYLNIRLLM